MSAARSVPPDPWDYLSDDERARLFRHFSPQAVQRAMRSQGLDVTCEDPVTLRAAAKIHARAIVQAQREDTAKAQREADADGTS